MCPICLITTAVGLTHVGTAGIFLALVLKPARCQVAQETERRLHSLSERRPRNIGARTPSKSSRQKNRK